PFHQPGLLLRSDPPSLLWVLHVLLLLRRARAPETAGSVLLLQPKVRGREAPIAVHLTVSGDQRHVPARGVARQPEPADSRALRAQLLLPHSVLRRRGDPSSCPGGRAVTSPGGPPNDNGGVARTY